MPFLFHDGWARVLPATKAERSMVGRHLNAMKLALAGQADALAPFEGESIFDLLRGRRVPFVTDLQTIVEFDDASPNEFIGFYKRRNELTPFEARDYV